MKFLDRIPVYGDQKWRGKCPIEAAEQVTFFNRLRSEYPDTYGRIALHPRNEGKRHHTQTAKQKAEGMATGASDVVIPGAPAFVCELKRRDHTKCTWQGGQQEYLRASQDAGAFACVALGWEAAWQAFGDWLALQKQHGA